MNLFDNDGKPLGKPVTLTSKSDLVHPWLSGQSLTIGQREIEVEGVMDAERFKSGRCFVGAAGVRTAAVKPALAKPFKVPTMKSSSQLSVTANSKNDAGAVTDGSLSSSSGQVVPQPRYRADAENALVMTRPPLQHQKTFNQQRKRSTVDVVVDPVLAKHLRPHQREGVSFMFDCVTSIKDPSVSGAILADSMGLGKTLQTVALVWTLLKQTPYFGDGPLCKRVLIVCPATLVQHWKKEFKKWLGDQRIKVFTVPKDSANETANKDINAALNEFESGLRIYPVLITNYERVRTMLPRLKKFNFDLMICDEGHRIKDANIKTSQSLNSLNCKRKLLLSGTPIQNDLTEFYSMIDFVNSGILGSHATFKRIYEEPIMKSRLPSCSAADKELGASRLAELSRLTGMFVLRRSAEVNEKYLPKKQELILFCPMSEVQTSLYQSFLDLPCIASLKSRYHEATGFDIGAHFSVIHALRKTVNACQLVVGIEKGDGIYDHVSELLDTVFPNENGDHTFDLESNSGKLAALLKLIESVWLENPDDKIIVVSNFTQTLDVIEKSFKSKDWDAFRLDGSTPSHKRMNLVDRFNDHEESPKLFLLSTKSGGVGLTLTGASRLVLFDPDWNPSHDAQAMARVWRDGQTKPVFIYRMLTAGTIDENIFQRGACKRALSDNFMDDKGDVADKFSPSELRDLFTLYETSCRTHDLLNCNCDEAETDDKENEGPKKKKKFGNESSIAFENRTEWIDKWTHISPRNGSNNLPLKEIDSALYHCKDAFSFIFASKA